MVPADRHCRADPAVQCLQKTRSHLFLQSIQSIHSRPASRRSRVGHASPVTRVVQAGPADQAAPADQWVRSGWVLALPGGLLARPVPHHLAGQPLQVVHGFQATPVVLRSTTTTTTSHNYYFQLAFNTLTLPELLHFKPGLRK